MKQQQIQDDKSEIKEGEIISLIKSRVRLIDFSALKEGLSENSQKTNQFDIDKVQKIKLILNDFEDIEERQCKLYMLEESEKGFKKDWIIENKQIEDQNLFKKLKALGFKSKKQAENYLKDYKNRFKRPYITRQKQENFYKMFLRDIHPNTTEEQLKIQIKNVYDGLQIKKVKFKEQFTFEQQELKKLAFVLFTLKGFGKEEQNFRVQKKYFKSDEEIDLKQIKYKRTTDDFKYEPDEEINDIESDDEDAHNYL